MNDISKRQNEDISIKCLAAQRRIYNEAKTLAVFDTVISLFIPLILSAMQMPVNDNAHLHSLIDIAVIICFLLPPFIEKNISKEQGLAAQVQQAFDIYVFQMPWDNRLFGEKKDLNSTIAEKSLRFLKAQDKKQQLIDWYSPDVEKFDQAEGILMCQKENLNWDVRLRIRFKYCAISIVIILAILVLGIGLFNNETITAVLDRVIFIFPMVRWLLMVNDRLDTDISNIESASGQISSSDKEMISLQWNQKYIYDLRKSCFLIPNGFYKLFRKHDNDVASDTMKLNI